MWMFDDRGTKIMAALALMIGLIASSSIIGESISAMKKGERYVTVRGVAEKEVKADIAIWPIRVRIAGNDLVAASLSAEKARKKVYAFLTGNGIKAEDVASQNLRVEDRQAKDYDQGKTGFRYVVEYTVLVRTAEVDKVQKISQMTDKLLAAGVVVASQGNWDRSGPQFVYTQLNAIKPEMMASATKAAREVAAQFAADSGSNLGGIRRATQGLFSISYNQAKIADRARYSDVGAGENDQHEINKKVRVVVTVDYLINN
jgi:uncharacterized protein